MNELSDLPIFKAFNEIKDAFHSSPSLVLKSPTGSGKSIGLPLLLLKENLVQGQILVVQPRRIAARLLARRVAGIMGSEIGDSVGYQVRFENKTSRDTKIIYLTDGVLFRKILSDPLLSRVGLVIFDEFHERSLQMDTSLALLRELQNTERPSIKLVVTSATLSLEQVTQYLPKSKSLELSFRNYPVEIEYRSMQLNEVIWKRVTFELRKCLINHDGDVLIFASGAFEISRIIQEIKSAPWAKSLLVRPLYGDMRIEDQEFALKKTAERKIIVSTNIAETSLTVEGVRIVIDTGVAKRSSFDPVRGVNVLLAQKISKSAADQRAGRAGRMSSGYCLRLWGEKEHENRENEEVPAIKRLDLSEIYLNLCIIEKNPISLCWLDNPSVESLDRARSTLHVLGALCSNSLITDKGREICKFPVNPKLGMALLLAKDLGCLPAFALALALIEDRSPIIHKEFNQQIVDSFLSKTFAEKHSNELDSDLRLLLGVWLYAKEEEFSVDRCKYVGIHALRCREAEKLAFRFCKIAGLNSFHFEFPKMRDFAEVFLVAFPDHLARLKSRGTGMYESINGIHLHVSKFSEVQKAEWVIALRLVEKALKGKIGLEMEHVTELNDQIVKDVLRTRVISGEEVALHSDTRQVIRREYDQIGTIKFNVKEREGEGKEDFQNAYSTELKAGNLSLKKWDNQVDHFVSKISFLCTHYPEYNVPQFSSDLRHLLFEEICKDAKSWKEIRNREVLPVLQKLYSIEELDLLEQATPSTFSLNNGKRPYRITYEGSHAVMRVKLQDLYDISKQPRVVFEKHRVTLHILAPNERCVQVTNNINEFWLGSYLEIKKELAGRYPKHEWR